MAFIYRADKDQNIFQISSNIVGPGEYLDKYPKFTPKQNQEPFLSSSDKLPEQISETPGPGTYYKDTQHLKHLKNLEKSIHNSNIDLVIARVKKDSITLHPAEKLGFDTKVKRFNLNGNSTLSNFNKTPGPGQYFPSILNKVEKKKIFIKNNKLNLDKNKLIFMRTKSKLRNNDKQGLSTVVIESDSHKINNKLRKTFQYDNFACRPKLYNIRKYKEIMENNESNSLSSTNYSDKKNRNKFNQFMRTYYTSGEFKNFNELNNSYNNENYEINKELFELYKNRDSENKNALKFRVNFCKKMNQKIIKNKIVDDIDKILEDKTPGPGYYFDDIIKNNQFYTNKQKKINIQNFGSTVKRFYAPKKPWTNLGPGEYINIGTGDKSTKKNRNKENPTNIDIPFNSKEKRNNTFLCLENHKDNPGPGNYEYKPFTNEVGKDPNPLIDKQFGFTGERFNDKYIMKDKYNAPGPAYYSSKINSIWYNNKKIKMKQEKMMLNPSNSNDEINAKKLEPKNQFLNGKYSSLDEFKFRDNVPPVGYYYPEYFSTIEYKNKRNIINSKNSDICFNKGISKTLKKSDSAPNIIGPGYYKIDRETYDKGLYSGIHPAFISSAEKKSFPGKKRRYKLNLEEIGKFYMQEYFKWNKKSFNVLFV